MFTVERREQLLQALMEAARSDDPVAGAALVGSLARHDADRWSDIDLAFGLTPDADVIGVSSRWSVLMNELGPVADHLDIEAGEALYRVFLLRDSLQVDLSFWPSGSFGSTGEVFEVLFGEPEARSEPPLEDTRALLRWGWLYALHAKSAIQRGKNWQALQMIDGLRDHLIALACLRHDLPPLQGRGVDCLHEEERASLAGAIATGLELHLLQQAFAEGLHLLTSEARRIDEPLAQRLVPALGSRVSGCTGSGQRDLFYEEMFGRKLAVWSCDHWVRVRPGWPVRVSTGRARSGCSTVSCQ